MKSRACGGSPSYKSRGSCKHNLMLDSKNRLLPLPNHVGPINAATRWSYATYVGNIRILRGCD